MKFNKVIKIYADLDRSQPCNIDFYGKDSLTSVIRGLQYDVRTIKNRAMRMSYDYDANQYDYYKFVERCKAEVMAEHFPSATIQDFSKYKTFDGFIYNALASDYPNIHKHILSGLARKVWGEYKNDKKQIVAGEKSLRTYGKDQPITIPSRECKLEYIDDFNYVFTASVFSSGLQKELGMNRGGIKFILRDQTESERAILNRLVSGEYKLTECQLAYDPRKNRRTKQFLGWYFCIGYSFEKDTANPELDKNKILGVDLGETNVVYCGWNGDPYFKRYIPGSELKKFNNVIDKRKRELQMSRVTRGGGSIGHGRKCAMKVVDKQGEYVHNFMENKNWHYAHFVVDTAIENGFGVIQMEDLSGITNSEKFNRHWTFYSLQQKITQIATENGIEVRKINPKHTSQRCSKCGFISKDNRKTQAVFKCTACGFTKNADHNAAMNISISNIEELIEQQLKVQNAA